MKRSVFLFTAMMLAFSVSAQKISGKIADATWQQPIGNATIKINGNLIVANADGDFVGNGIQPPYQLEIAAVGFETSAITLSEWPKNGLQLTLYRKNQLLQPVEVKAIRAGEKSPFSQTTLQKKDIEKSNLGQDLPFLLNQLPSVVVNSDAGNGVGYTGLRIRGSDATRINMTINGLPYNDAESQGIFFVNLPDFASSVSSVQVQRGVGTSSNGAGAFGATLNFSTNEFRDKAYAEIFSSAGSFNTLKNTVKVGSGLIDNHFTVDARLSRITSDGFVDRASSNLQSFYLSGAYIGKQSTFRLNVLSGKEKTYQAWYGVTADDLVNNRTVNYAGTEKPGEPYNNETDNYQQDHYQAFFNHQFNNNLLLNIAGFYSYGRGYYEQYKAGESFGDYGLSDPIINGQPVSSTDLIRQLWLDNHFYGGTFSLQQKINQFDWAVGGGYNQYRGDHFGKVIWAEVGIPNQHQWYGLDAFKNDANLYAKISYQINKAWQLFGDLQYRNVTYDLNGFRNNPTLFVQNNWHFFNPKAGITYAKGNRLASVSYAVGNKEPNRDDFEAGAANQPKHETLHNIEANYSVKTSNLQWSLTGFYMRYKNQLVLTGKINDVGAYARTNIDDSYRLGIEGQVNWKPFENIPFQIIGNLAWSENKLLDFVEFIDDYDNGGQKTNQIGKTTISFSPTWVGGATLQYTHNKWLNVGVETKWVSRQYLDNTAQRSRSIDGYITQDAQLNCNLPVKWTKQLSLQCRVNNIWNTLFETNGYSFSYIYGGQQTTENFYFPMAGTNVMAGITLKL